MTQQQLIELVNQALASQIESLYPALFGVQSLVVLFAAAIGATFGAWFSGYGRRKGENRAAKEDHQELLRQIKINTSTVEEIKIELAATDWVTKEWKTLRRQKLEEMITSMVALCDHQQALQDSAIFNHGERPANIDLYPKITMLGEIYFPECQELRGRFKLAARKLATSIHSTQLELLRNANNSAVSLKLRQDFKDQSLDLIVERDAAMDEIIKNVSGLVREAYQPSFQRSTSP